MNRRIDEIPVSDRLDAAVANGMQRVKFIHRKQLIKKSIAMAASFAILLGGFFVWGFSNPVLASQIPIIGRIFMENEEKISFPGNYSEKADVLDTTTKVPVIITPDTTEATSTEEDATEPIVEMVPAYSTHDAGYQITANEVYCDGSSIPFTVDSESVREYAINDRNEQGFGVGKIIITPFEVKIEYFRSSPDADYGTSVFDANGNRLLFHEENSSEETDGVLATYPVSDADISTLHIYIGEDGIECIKETDQNAMANRAVYSYTLDTTTEK